MTKKRTIVGVSAILCLVTLNLRHAWNNYGITEDSWVKEAFATPAGPPEKHECGSDENGNIKYCNARVSETPNMVICEFYFTYITLQVAEAIYYNKANKTYQVTKWKDVVIKKGSHNDSGWIFCDPDDYDYIMEDDYRTGNLIGKADASRTKIEHEIKTVHLNIPKKECVSDYNGSCLSAQDLSTACQVEFEQNYANGTN